MTYPVAGEGLVLLLQGMTSVGKKSTAGKPGVLLSSLPLQFTDFFMSTACVARMAGVPLLSISIGEMNQTDTMVRIGLEVM